MSLAEKTICLPYVYKQYVALSLGQLITYLIIFEHE